MSTQDNRQHGDVRISWEESLRRQRRLAIKLVLLCLVVGAVVSYVVFRRQQPIPTAVAWRAEFKVAAAQATAERKYVFLQFYAPWSSTCRKMDRDVFSRPDIAQVIEEVAVPLRLDVDTREGKVLAKYYGMETFPAYMVLTPDGQEVASRGGLLSAEKLLHMLGRGPQQAEAADSQSTPVSSPTTGPAVADEEASMTATGGHKAVSTEPAAQPSP